MIIKEWLWLRKADCEKDSEFVYNLRNSEDVRKLSLNTKKIPLKEHLKFFAKHYKEYQIIMYDEKRTGYLRQKDREISIALLKEYRGKGIGTEILKKTTGKAIVKTMNEASVKAFRKAGFEIKGYYMEMRRR